MCSLACAFVFGAACGLYMDFPDWLVVFLLGMVLSFSSTMRGYYGRE